MFRTLASTGRPSPLHVLGDVLIIPADQLEVDEPAIDVSLAPEATVHSQLEVVDRITVGESGLHWVPFSARWLTTWVPFSEQH